MHAETGQLYHLYNQGNNKEALFLESHDYDFFIALTQNHLSTVCEILAWCLMPNHFHFCIQATEESVKEVVSGKLFIQAFSKSVGSMLSSYAAVANVKHNKSGARFRPKTKLKLIADTGNGFYDATLIRYLHYNPVEAGLVAEPEDWPYSSARDYARLREEKLCNLDLARRLGLWCP